MQVRTIERNACASKVKSLPMPMSKPCRSVFYPSFFVWQRQWWRSFCTSTILWASKHVSFSLHKCFRITWSRIYHITSVMSYAGVREWAIQSTVLRPYIGHSLNSSLIPYWVNYGRTVGSYIALSESYIQNKVVGSSFVYYLSQPHSPASWLSREKENY